MNPDPRALESSWKIRYVTREPGLRRNMSGPYQNLLTERASGSLSRRPDPLPDARLADRRGRVLTALMSPRRRGEGVKERAKSGHGVKFGRKGGLLTTLFAVLAAFLRLIIRAG